MTNCESLQNGVNLMEARGSGGRTGIIQSQELPFPGTLPHAQNWPIHTLSGHWGVHLSREKRKCSLSTYYAVLGAFALLCRCGSLQWTGQESGAQQKALAQGPPTSRWAASLTAKYYTGPPILGTDQGVGCCSTHSTGRKAEAKRR